MKRLFLILLLAASPADCQTSSNLITIIIDTSPEGAQIVDTYQNHLGISGQPMTVNTTSYGSSAAFFTASKEGYDKLAINIPIVRLKQGGHYPDKPLLLSPENFLVVIKQNISDHPALTGLGLLLALGAAGLKLGGLQKKRARRLQAQRKRDLDASQEDSLVSIVLGGYRLIKVLGKGGMATVYRALPEANLDPAQAVAVKVLHRDALVQDWQRFRREVVIAKGLVHPSIVALIDYGDVDGKRYLVMECIEGTSLREALPLPQPRARQVLREIGAAVVYAHSRGVVHRDLKPENIMVPPHGSVKVMDFGLAKSDTSSHMTATGTVMGTPSYMAPEQIQGKPFSPSMDQYAVGIIAFELFTGKLPFEADDPVQMIYAHLSEEPPLPSQKSDTPLPQAIDRVILRMLAKDPDARYADLAQALEAVEASWE